MEGEFRLIQNLSKKLYDLCLKTQNVISTAESCTAGMLSFSITITAGSSQIFDRAYVTYSNQSKMEILDISEKTITRHGAVSPQTAFEMAKSVLQKSSKTTIAISITGIAGPGGATKNKPVGLVYISIAIKNNKTFIFKKIFNGDRNFIRHQTVIFTLEKIIELIQKN